MQGKKKKNKKTHMQEKVIGLDADPVNDGWILGQALKVRGGSGSDLENMASSL